MELVESGYCTKGKARRDKHIRLDQRATDKGGGEMKRKSAWIKKWSAIRAGEELERDHEESRTERTAAMPLIDPIKEKDADDAMLENGIISLREYTKRVIDRVIEREMDRKAKK